MATSRLLRALRVVGYVTTAIVVAEAVAIALAIWLPAHRTSMWVSKATRTYERPLDAASEDRLTASAAQAFAPIRPPANAATDALGFVFMPSFSDWTAMSLSRPRPDGAVRAVIVKIHDNDATRELTFGPIQTFSVPATAYREAAKRLDRLTDGFGGNRRRPCYDGAAVAFERRRGARVTSGAGQAGCSEKHYLAAEAIMQELLARYGPGPPPSVVVPTHEGGA